MNVHQNARLTPHSRAELVRWVVVEGQTPKAVAAAFNGQNRAQVGGALPDRRRQRPARSLLPAPSPAQADAGSDCRDRRSNRIQALEPAAPVRRDEREHPGELIKKIGRFDCVGHRITGDRTGQSKRRGVGWEFVHIGVDDASRVAVSQLLPDEKKESAVAFLKATVASYTNLGVTIARVMTDYGSGSLEGLSLRLPRSRPQARQNQA